MESRKVAELYGKYTFQSQKYHKKYKCSWNIDTGYLKLLNNNKLLKKTDLLIHIYNESRILVKAVFSLLPFTIIYKRPWVLLRGYLFWYFLRLRNMFTSAHGCLSGWSVFQWTQLNKINKFLMASGMMWKTFVAIKNTDAIDYLFSI